MVDGDWDTGFMKAVAEFFSGDALTDMGPRGERVVDVSFILLMDLGSGVVDFINFN